MPGIGHGLRSKANIEVDFWMSSGRVRLSDAEASRICFLFVLRVPLLGGFEGVP